MTVSYDEIKAAIQCLNDQEAHARLNWSVVEG